MGNSKTGRIAFANTMHAQPSLMLRLRMHAARYAIKSIRMIDSDLNKVYNTLIKEIIAPFFKRLGFKKSGPNFFRSTEELIQTFNFQKHYSSYFNEVKFTGNIGFIEPTTYLKLYEIETLPTVPKSHAALIVMRLGRITHERDNWYSLSTNTDLENLKKELNKDLKVLEDFFEKRKTLSSIEDLLTERSNLNLFWGEMAQYALYKQLSKDKLASEILHKVYKQALTPRSWVTTITTDTKNNTTTEKKSKPEVNKYWVERIEKVARIYNETL